MSQSTISSKLNFQFIGGPTMLHLEGHNSSIQSTIAVNEHLMESLFDNLMESLFDKLSNRSSSISISRRQGHQIIKTCCRYFCQELDRHHGLVIYPWDTGPGWNMPQGDGEHIKESLGCPPPWPPP
jgi:hypothetical protein